MEKKIYNSPKIEIISINATSIICTSEVKISHTSAWEDAGAKSGFVDDDEEAE